MCIFLAVIEKVEFKTLHELTRLVILTVSFSVELDTSVGLILSCVPTHQDPILASVIC